MPWTALGNRGPGGNRTGSVVAVAKSSPSACRVPWICPVRVGEDVSPWRDGTPDRRSVFGEAVDPVLGATALNQVVDPGTWHAGEVAAERPQQFRQPVLDQVQLVLCAGVQRPHHAVVDDALRHLTQRHLVESALPDWEFGAASEVGIKEITARLEDAGHLGQEFR